MVVVCCSYREALLCLCRSCDINDRLVRDNQVMKGLNTQLLYYYRRQCLLVSTAHTIAIIGVLHNPDLVCDMDCPSVCYSGLIDEPCSNDCLLLYFGCADSLLIPTQFLRSYMMLLMSDTNKT